MAVPRSWPARITASATPATGTAGISACRHWCSNGSLRARTAPSHTASASLIASDGWAEMPPTRTQFWLPPTPVPNGVNTRSWNRIAAPSTGHANLLK